MPFLFSKPNLCFLLAASRLCIKYNYGMSAGNSNPQKVVFEEKSQTFAMTVEAGGLSR